MTNLDMYDPRSWRPAGTAIQDMHQPARCTWCSRVYDLGTVEVTARYVDCSMWKAPCCGAMVDDRGETGWKSRSDYVRLDKHTGQEKR